MVVTSVSRIVFCIASPEQQVDFQFLIIDRTNAF